ncbi:hypothetical protein CL617_05840 [archaeon]|nr:hypothetical protein [archaeon]|tara:strand:- start:15210 stop:15614 length:405 start_codon:yes stop_codon:yes gene_type:complete
MAISALRLDEESRYVLYSQKVETLDSYGAGPVVYSEDVQKKYLKKNEFSIVRRILEDFDWAKVDVINRESVKIRHYQNPALSSAKYYEKQDVLDRFLADVSNPDPNINFKYEKAWNIISGIVEILGKESSKYSS